MKESVVVICPGRGCYHHDELGYLHRHHLHNAVTAEIDNWLARQACKTVSELDALPVFDPALHLRGRHAASLIHTCALADFHAINLDRYEIVAITGNSMGWYIALACAGVLSQRGIPVVHTMASLLEGTELGMQLIYPLLDEDWQPDSHLADKVRNILEQAIENGRKIYSSIELGGLIAIGFATQEKEYLLQMLPKVGARYPLILPGHAAFHTPLLAEIPAQAMALLPATLFTSPTLPLIDGLGRIHWQWSAKSDSLHLYTLQTQIIATYFFARSIEVAIKEFAPDRMILLGPGNSMAPLVAQVLIQHRWRGIQTKADFIRMQKSDPFLLAMGDARQRELVIT